MTNTFQLGGDVFEVRTDVTNDTASEFHALMSAGDVVSALSLILIGRSEAKRVAEHIGALPTAPQRMAAVSNIVSIARANSQVGAS